MRKANCGSAAMGYAAALGSPLGVSFCWGGGAAGGSSATERGVQWGIYGLEMSHFETFQSWTPRYASHSETFRGWRAEKASHFETFRGWRAEKASHFESLGDFRLREVSHGESFGGCGLREVSHCESWRRPGSGRPSAWREGGERGRFCGVWTWAWCLAGRRSGVGFAGARVRWD